MRTFKLSVTFMLLGTLAMADTVDEQIAKIQNATPQNIKIVPTNELNHNFKVDYEDMAKSMIIGNPPTYEELIEFLQRIEEAIK